MAREVIVASLDIGDDRIKCVIALRHDDGQVDIIGTGVHPANGVQNGMIRNPDQVEKAIKAAVHEAELMAGCEINEVFVSASTRHFESFDSTGMTRITDTTVSALDIRNAIDMAAAVRMAPDQKVLHVVPQEFIVDGERRIADPLGMPGVRLEVNAHLVLGNTTALEAIRACCDGAGLDILDVVMSPLAQGEAMLTQQGRDVGVALIDIGSDTTDIAVFENGALVHTAVLALGGEHVTADIRDCLNTPTAEAENLKRAHGTAIAHVLDPDEIVEVPGVGGRRPRPVKRTLLCGIIEARVAEIFRLVAEELDRAGYEEGLAGGVILAGGTANLHYIEELAEEALNMPVARGVPKDLHGLVDVVGNPKYATATGLVLCGLRQRRSGWFGTWGHVEPRRRGFWSFLPWVGPRPRP